MGEVLRAILDKTSNYSKPVFYTGTIALLSTVTGARTFSRREISIPCKMDTWFLAIGAAQYSIFQGAAGQGVAARGEPTTFSVQRTANREPFSLTPQVKSNLNANLNNFVTWDEYLLFAPGELITLLEDVQITDVANAFTRTTSVVLMGIEYRMPSGKGGPGYGS